LEREQAREAARAEGESSTREQWTTMVFEVQRSVWVNGRAVVCR
jgi:hypothetical protein